MSNTSETKTIVVTGGAGYVGEILCAQLAALEHVRTLIVIDKAPQTEFLKALPKLVYLQENLADGNWQAVVAQYEPHVIIHAAWQIRELYGQRAQQAEWNLAGSGAVFDFAFTYPSVQRLIHFSTAASYSARATNTFDHYFTETESLRDDAYSYAAEKKQAEDELRARYEMAKKQGIHTPQVTIIRPAAITGPRGRFLRSRFGLQSALRGDTGSDLWGQIVRLLTKVFPATRGWVRQFIHEDDIAGAVVHFALSDTRWSYEVFNGTPLGEPVFPQDMARAVGKRAVMIWPSVIKLAFAFFWHATRGTIPTCPESWRFYAYPILMSGEKLSREYTCQFSSIDAITYTDGFYEKEIPSTVRRSRG